jgi:hypothetical protein
MSTDQLLDEILAGQGESLRQAARRFPSARRGVPVTRGCLLKWINAGVTLADGRVVTLEAAMIAGRLLTSGPAIRRFLAAQAAPTAAPPARTGRQQRGTTPGRAGNATR